MKITIEYDEEKFHSHGGDILLFDMDTETPHFRLPGFILKQEHDDKPITELVNITIENDFTLNQSEPTKQYINREQLRAAKKAQKKKRK